MLDKFCKQRIHSGNKLQAVSRAHLVLKLVFQLIRITETFAIKILCYNLNLKAVITIVLHFQVNGQFVQINQNNSNV